MKQHVASRCTKRYWLRSIGDHQVSQFFSRKLNFLIAVPCIDVGRDVAAGVVRDGPFLFILLRGGAGWCSPPLPHLLPDKEKWSDNDEREMLMMKGKRAGRRDN